MSNVTFPPAAAELRAQVRRFIADELAAGTFEPQCDAWMTGCSPEFSRKLGARGWLGMMWPSRYGGHDRSALERYVVSEELLAAGAPVAAHWISDRQTGPLLLRYGTEEQRTRFLPAIARGELYFAIGMSEPDSGSDLASVRTRAERTDGGWHVSGTKLWTSHAHHCQYVDVFCRTAAPTEDRHAGLSQLLVDLTSDGVEVRPIITLGGAHHFNELVLDEAYVPDEMVIGDVGAGWHQVTSELAFERSGPERFLTTLPLLSLLVDRLQDQAHSDLEAAEIGRIVAGASAVRELSLGVAAQLDAGHVPGTQAALVKDLGTRFEKQITAAARRLQPCEPSLTSESPYARRLAEAVLCAPGATLRGGTNEILRGIVARALEADAA